MVTARVTFWGSAMAHSWAGPADKATLGLGHDGTSKSLPKVGSGVGSDL